MCMENESKTLDNSNVDQAKDQVRDLKVIGDGDTFKLLFKASSQREGWMKSTKAMEIPGVGCLVQVTTQQGTQVAEALQFVPGVSIGPDFNNGRTLISSENKEVKEVKEAPVKSLPHELSPMLSELAESPQPLPVNEAEVVELKEERDMYKRLLGYAVDEFGDKGSIKVGVTVMAFGYHETITSESFTMDNGSIGVKVTSKVVKKPEVELV